MESVLSFPSLLCHKKIVVMNFFTFN
ncbi:hypothetical protein CAEBREN_01695 [Caenorhabditis brenneri]|uniref:Uncharacterized protein n=1 Tax=Caenorhabditis brenneri TaxID=135651 RepID=G0NQE7_CAEBE|nr:hypothetical protein CAEBREN_01695 [Caenorhabditis brenneri]